MTYLAVIDNTGSNSNWTGNLLNNGDEVLRYWVTLDGVLVTGTVKSVYTGLEKMSTIKKTDTPVISTLDDYQPNSL